MKPWNLAGSAALLALVAANPALADVTPEEVWQNWQDFYSSSGSTVASASAERDGDTLVVTDFTASLKEGSAQSETSIAEIRLRDTGDGAVEITMSDEIGFTSSGPGVDGAPAFDAEGTLRLPGMTGTVSGAAGDMTYAFVAPSIEMEILPKEDGKEAGKITMLLSNAKSTSRISGPADATQIDSSFDAATAALNIEVAEGETNMMGSLNAADLAGKVTGNFAGLEEEDVTKALGLGFAIDASLTYGALNYDFDVTDEAGPANLTGGSEGGAFQVAMDAARILFSGSGKNVVATLSGAQLPFPELTLSYAESGFNLTMPVSKADAPQDFAFLTRIVDLEVSEDLWAMIDPTGAVPHDPATLVIDTAGKVLLKSDLMADPAEGSEMAPDAELHALDVRDVTARIAGAELTGAGAFTFDNTDMTTFDGVPTPTGKLDLKLVGGNTLLDKLVAMGLLTEDDAMGARMMMAMFAKAADGEDTLTSTLEFKDKHFYANGQQLQ